MRIYFFATLLTLISLPSLAQKLHSLAWTADHRLVWNDFKGRPEAGSGNAALTTSSIDVRYSITRREFDYSIRCHFDQDQSWGRVRTSYILSHEQGHFDIAEIYARKLNMALKNYRFNGRHAERDINRIYQRIMDEHHQAQKRYDHETNYSRNREKQHRWLVKIDGMLNDYQIYANYRSPGSNYFPNSGSARSRESSTAMPRR